MGNVVFTYQDYWTFVQAYRRGERRALGQLELMALGHGRAARLAKKFCEDRTKIRRTKDATH